MGTKTPGHSPDITSAQLLYSAGY